MKLYVIIGADGFVFDIDTTLARTRARVRAAVGALAGCTVAEYRVPQHLQNIRALFAYTFGRHMPVEAHIVRAWQVSRRGAMRLMHITDYAGLHARLQRRVLGTQAAPRRVVESYFDPRLAEGDGVLPIDSDFGDRDSNPIKPDGYEEAGRVDGQEDGQDDGESTGVFAGSETLSGDRDHQPSLPA